MFATSQVSPSRQRSASHSTDDQSNAKGEPCGFFRRYAHDLSLSSQSLAITDPRHDDLPTPTYPSHSTSAQSTPMTSPSVAHSSFVHGSLSSATSESGPSPDSKFRSEFGVLTRGSSAHSPIRGSASSRASHPVSPRSPSTTESDTQALGPRRLPHKCSSSQILNRPSTADHLPPVPTTPTAADSTPAEGHARTSSRLAVSIKNLFTRPVIPSPSRFSFNSTTTMPSDSDASSPSRHVPASGSKWSMTPRKSRPPDLDVSGSLGVAMPSPDRPSDPQIDVHRRYASEAVAKIYNAKTGSGPPMSQDSFDAPVRNESPVLVRGREHRPRNVLRRRPSGSAKLLKGRKRGMSVSAHPSESSLRQPPDKGTSRFDPVPPLTPAGAVAEAYKQQELHRDGIPDPPELFIDDQMNARAYRDSGYDREHSPRPYYTVFGTFSGHQVRVGGPDDRRSRFEAHPSAWNALQGTPVHQASASDSGVRNLTRKVSSRWRKAKEGGVASEESPVRGRGHSKGRSSLQELWGRERANTRATGLSIDGISNVEGGAWASPAASHARSGTEKEGGNEGGKFWRLMRRISTGGLRDRCQSDKVVPPVPAIPKGLLKKNQHECDPVSTSPSNPSSDSHDKNHTSPKIIPDAQTSVATTSSSPNSSDVASMRFFNRTLSARSSVSSYGEPVAKPRTSEVSIDQHIIAPLEQLRLGDDHAKSGKPCSSLPRCPRRSVSVPAGLRTAEDNESDRAPLPSPRRLACSRNPPSSTSSRPASASASGSESPRVLCQGKGHGVGRSRMKDGIVSLSPPPRAQKSTRRGGGSAASLPSHSTLVKQVEGGVRQMDRTPSARSDMTARVESPSLIQSRDQDTARARLTFRELEAPRRPPLSEREKADIWDDLLARSDKAGGTLHINGAAELMSDNMRFSMHSEI